MAHSVQIVRPDFPIIARVIISSMNEASTETITPIEFGLDKFNSFQTFSNVIFSDANLLVQIGSGLMDEDNALIFGNLLETLATNITTSGSAFTITGPIDLLCLVT